MTCPKCHADAVARSHRSGTRERLISRLAVFPFRCACGARFYRLDFESFGRRHSSARLGSEFKLYGIGLALFAVFLYFIARG